jgi:uncharacterized protein
MKKIIPFIAILFFASCKKEEFDSVLTKEFALHAANGGDYKIKVGLPTHYSPDQKYNTLYILDGEEDFDYVANECREISKNMGKKNVLVVSIGYGKPRHHDYTPTDAAEGDGGAPQFMEFISKELIPEIERNFAADTTRKARIILGHSFGGLFAAYAFTSHNPVFENYIMLSPSLWYDDEIILRYEQENRLLNKNNRQLVYLGIGELENGGRMQAPFEAFYQRLLNYYPGMKLTKHIVRQLNHNGSKNKNITEGLKYYFENI